jgi:LETM1 and EF-hand domain-containing protein 1
LEELAKEQKRIAANRKDGSDADSIASKQEASASDMLEFLDRARKGEMMPADVIIRYANYFQDDLTLDNMPRMQLINMCKYMSIAPYGADSFLRFQLRHRIRMLKEDDQRILWEGIDSLTKMELREACQERGMRSTGLSKEAYKRSLQQWLDLSVNKNVPISLLIMSRTFFLQEEMVSPEKAATSDESHSVVGLADAISGMDKEVLNEVILQVATSEEKKSDPDVRKIKLEVLTQQNEKIKEEQEERENAKKKKESSEKAGEGQPATPAPEGGDKKKSLAAKASILDGPIDVDKISEKEILERFDEKVEKIKEDLVVKAAELETGERELSAEEMEAISQLLSADPVFKEREDLARIKEAMREKIEEVESQRTDETQGGKETEYKPTTDVDDEKRASTIIETMESKAAKEADKSTSFSTSTTTTKTRTDKKSEEKATLSPSLKSEDKPVGRVVKEEEHHVEDPVVARLKKRIESMVNKIETQLSDVHIKIGEKLHYLDKDMDGILSREEMAEVLSQVLKNISFEEALEIADGIDDNKDGVFTVQELIQWIETNKLVKFEKEGRDADMDKIMESQSSEKENKEGGNKPQNNNTEEESNARQKV